MNTEIALGASKPQLIILDVYDTLLDMSQVEHKINGLLNSKRGYRIWFELMMQHCFVDSLTGGFHEFSDISKATLAMTAKLLDTPAGENMHQEALVLMKHIPLNEGVQKGLSMLSDQGYRLAALTNSGEDIVNERMERTGLVSYFEFILSADEVKKYKPAKEVYQAAAKKAQLKEDEILMVSSHGWDLAGAANAGMHTAFIKKEDQLLYPLTPTPSLIVNDLTELATKLETVFA